jgi:hypothetical protein
VAAVRGLLIAHPLVTSWISLAKIQLNTPELLVLPVRAIRLGGKQHTNAQQIYILTSVTNHKSLH